MGYYKFKFSLLTVYSYHSVYSLYEYSVDGLLMLVVSLSSCIDTYVCIYTYRYIVIM